MQIFLGDSLEILPTLQENSVDSIVTDPPYELGFMGKKWDSTGIANNVQLWKECLRVLKPGGHLLAFSGTRTYHRMAVAIEDAGFEVRDMIEWVYSTGFPKSLNIGKAVDKLQGNEREIIGKYQLPDVADGLRKKEWDCKAVSKNSDFGASGQSILTKGTSEWEGWGTALKPAHEPICMARKPLAEKTVAENCLKWGTGGINIDESRVESNEELGRNNNARTSGTSYVVQKETMRIDNSNGKRFPANLIHDNSEEVRECFPESKSTPFNAKKPNNPETSWKMVSQDYAPTGGYEDNGNASRFFKSIIYQAKASKSERNKGCEGLEEKQTGSFDGNADTVNTNRKIGADPSKPNAPRQNFHPTIKPIALMEYLIKMVTPKGGTVLDPFMGSGSTGVACKENGFDFIGIDMTPEYVEIAKARMNSVNNLFSSL